MTVRTFKLTKTIALAATVGVLASLALAGCSSSSTSESCGTTSGSVSDSVKATGTIGKKPTVTFKKGLTTKTTQRSVITKGSGAEIEKGQIANLQVTLYNGRTGSKTPLETTDYTKKAGSPFTAGKTTGQAFNALSAGLVCAHVGDRLAIVGNPEDSTLKQGITSLKVKKTDSIVFVVDVLKVGKKPLTRATGTKEAPVAGEPTVTLAKNGAPTITTSSAAAPTSLVATTLIKGNGVKVASGDTITVQYTGALYSNGTVFDSSWKNGSAFTTALSKSSLIAGWVDGLAGKTVGSQVLLVIPPAEGYGATAQSTIPANSTLIFVIDILGKS